MTSPSADSTHPISAPPPKTHQQPITLGAHPISSTQSVSNFSSHFTLSSPGTSIPKSFQVSPIKVSFWDDSLTSTPGKMEHQTHHVSPSKKIENTSASSERKYPKLLPIEEIRKLENASEDCVRLSVPVAPTMSNVNGLILQNGGPVCQQDTTLVNASSVSVSSVECEGDSTILYGSGPVAPHPPIPSSTTEHAHNLNKSHDGNAETLTNTWVSPLISKEFTVPDKPPVAKTKEPSESPIPDTPPTGSPLMFDSGESSETNYIFAEASKGYGSIIGEEEKKMDAGTSSPDSSHSWHTPPQEVIEQKPTGDSLKTDQDIPDREKEVLAPPQSRNSAEEPSAPLRKTRRSNLRVSARKSSRLSLNVSRLGRGTCTTACLYRKALTKVSSARVDKFYLIHWIQVAPMFQCSEALLCRNDFTIGERAELKAVFSKKYGHFKIKDIRSSKLWKHMQGGSKKKVEVVLVPAANLKCSPKTSEE